ncbi:hypothetical protein FQN55_004945 [Onygenales sp. PD_40]|nr:hypothetical protein FQN55_004945 [Onygenales sp. PD_40]
MAAREQNPLDPEEDSASNSGCISHVRIVAMVAPSILMAAMAKNLNQDKGVQNKHLNNPSLIPQQLRSLCASTPHIVDSHVWPSTK